MMGSILSRESKKAKEQRLLQKYQTMGRNRRSKRTIRRKSREDSDCQRFKDMFLGEKIPMFAVMTNQGAYYDFLHAFQGRGDGCERCAYNNHESADYHHGPGDCRGRGDYPFRCNRKPSWTPARSWVPSPSCSRFCRTCKNKSKVPPRRSERLNNNSLLFFR